MFQFTKTKIPDVIVVEPQVFGDERGFFMETYLESDFKKNNIFSHFVQDNHSKSKAGVLRGLHFQTINTQAKLVRVVSGSVYDVVVDLRKGSPTYGQWIGEVLSAINKKQLYVPRGFAHGFLTLEDDTEFVYKCDDVYNPAGDGGIAYNSPELDINWSEHYSGELIISEKDQKHLPFQNEKTYFGFGELTENRYIYIDTQNIWQSLKSDGWLIDWQKFRVYLADKFKAQKVYMFVGYIMENKDFYDKLQSWGYDVIHKETRKIKGKVKGNVDAELVMQVMKDIHIFSSAILVTSDGDFACVVDELQKLNKFSGIMPPNYKYCSYLLKGRAEGKIYDIINVAQKFCKKIDTKK